MFCESIEAFRALPADKQTELVARQAAIVKGLQSDFDCPRVLASNVEQLRLTAESIEKTVDDEITHVAAHLELLRKNRNSRIINAKQQYAARQQRLDNLRPMLIDANELLEQMRSHLRTTAAQPKIDKLQGLNDRFKVLIAEFRASRPEFAGSSDEEIIAALMKVAADG